MTKAKSTRWAKYKLIFALPIVIISLVAFTNNYWELPSSSLSIGKVSQKFTNPKGWYLSGAQPASYKTGNDNQVFLHGQKSAFIESVVESPSGFTTLMQTCNVKDYKGKRIKMTGYIKSKELSDSSSMWIRIDDFEKKITADFDNMMDRPILGGKDWTKCEIVFDVPNSECTLFYGFILGGAGKIWVDNVSFEVVNSATPKTAYNMNAALPSEYFRQLEEYPKGLPERLPVNLDFEE